ncbi:hypothetical protein NEE14_005080 [Parabacteroides sp. AD58]|uniref:Uncharacterized protein n=1 Tax=Parabacteroides absconsus TaxID=2951805 RepID=A0ABZ2IN67_9BACT|nr:hypothetical protein [Parabacteroides sp. AD58]MCM6901351.1 hypothetical protein [Parabacteroides sp. AD58]MCM6901986.1 hypothetical protein [Parabacteroides sp. AD58]
MAEKEIRVLEEREAISIFIRRRSVASTHSAIKRKHRSQLSEDIVRNGAKTAFAYLVVIQLSMAPGKQEYENLE